MAWRIERKRDSHAAQANCVHRRCGGKSEIAAPKERLRFRNDDFEILCWSAEKCMSLCLSRGILHE